MNKKDIIIIAILACIALYSLFADPRFILVHDQVQPERVYEMSEAIISGQIPPRMVGNLGYGLGYPLFNYYAPLPYYIGAIFKIIGFQTITATKLIIAIGFIFSAVTMYYCARMFWSKRQSLLAAILYMLAPYHAVQLYVRGAVGELYAYACLPLIIAGLYESIKEHPHKKNIIISAIGMGLLSISHTVSLYMALYALTLWMVSVIVYRIMRRKPLKEYIKQNIIIICIPLIATAYFWLPAFAEIPLIHLSLETGNEVNFRDHFLSAYQLWSSPWGYGGSAKGTEQDGMSFMIGKATIVLATFGMALLLIQKRKLQTRVSSKSMYVLAITALITLAHMVPIAKPIWENIPYFNLIQFPWRFLTHTNAMLVLLAPLACEVLIYAKNKSIQNYATYALIAAVSIYSLFSLSPSQFMQIKYFKAKGYQNVTEEEITSISHLRFQASKIADEYLPKRAVRPQSQQEVSKDTIQCSAACQITNIIIKPSMYAFTVNAQEKTEVYIDKVYFPHYKAKVNGKEELIHTTNPNTMMVKIDKGKNNVIIKLHNTPIRTGADALSATTMIAGLIILIKKMPKREQIQT